MVCFCDTAYLIHWTKIIWKGIQYQSWANYVTVHCIQESGQRDLYFTIFVEIGLPMSSFLDFICYQGDKVCVTQLQNGATEALQEIVGTYYSPYQLRKVIHWVTVILFCHVDVEHKNVDIEFLWSVIFQVHPASCSLNTGILSQG